MSVGGRVGEGRFIEGVRMWRPRIRRLYEGFRDVFEEAGLLDDFARIPNYTNETLIIVEGYRDRLHPVLLWTFILDTESRIEEFARACWKYVGTSTVRVLCNELRGLLEEEWGDVYG
jgi:hypothetical protein